MKSSNAKAVSADLWNSVLDFAIVSKPDFRYDNDDDNNDDDDTNADIDENEHGRRRCLLFVGLPCFFHSPLPLSTFPRSFLYCVSTARTPRKMPGTRKSTNSSSFARRRTRKPPRLLMVLLAVLRTN